ncbi:MAG TPA: sterol desaturase family protein [Stellaceae bacterium]|nr:sterol desaturase family protein [Stellaceae bacterium]
MIHLLTGAQDWLFETLILPALYQLGLMEWDEYIYDALWFVMLGMLAIGVGYAVFSPLEKRWPAEQQNDRRARRADMLYTLLARLGVIPAVFFLTLLPLRLWIEQRLADAGWSGVALDQWVPWLASHAFATFCLYALVLDFVEYWRHRLQHSLEWWWSLHSLHHSQRSMSFWTDDRNHILDEASRYVVASVVAVTIGVPPGQFFLLVMLMGIFESFTHANVRIRFGWLGERLLVSPRYHRLHHAMGMELASADSVRNYATLFPIWDVLFGTADFGRSFPATGIGDHPRLGQYPAGFIGQQAQGLVRLVLWAGERLSLLRSPGRLAARSVGLPPGGVPSAPSDPAGGSP